MCSPDVVSYARLGPSRFIMHRAGHAVCSFLRTVWCVNDDRNFARAVPASAMERTQGAVQAVS